MTQLHFAGGPPKLGFCIPFVFFGHNEQSQNLLMSILVRMEWRPDGWSVCLPLLIFPCTIKSRRFLLALAHPCGPRKRAVKRLRCSSRAKITEDILAVSVSLCRTCRVV